MSEMLFNSASALCEAARETEDVYFSANEFDVQIPEVAPHDALDAALPWLVEEARSV